MHTNRVKPGQGVQMVERLNIAATAHNGNGFEFWIEWQPQPAPDYDLRDGYYLHVIYEYIKIDRSLTELSSRWRSFKYGIWLGATMDAAAGNLSNAVQITKGSFDRITPEIHEVPLNLPPEIIEL